jgi:hypothetical protein
MALRGCFGESDASSAYFLEPGEVVVHYAFETFDCAEDCQNFVEAAGNLIKETDFDLIEVFVHLPGLLGCLLPIPGEELFVDQIGSVKEDHRYIFVAPEDEFRAQGGGLLGFGFAILDDFKFIPGEGLQVGLKLSGGNLGGAPTVAIHYVDCSVEQRFVLVGLDCSFK